MALLELLVPFFGGGAVVPDHGKMQYRVRDHVLLGEAILPHFTKYGLLTKKSADFQDFATVHALMANGAHLTPEGLDTIRTIKAGMNRGRK